MATKRYLFGSESTIQQIDIAPNSFGRRDAVLYPGESPDAGSLVTIAEKLSKSGIVAYPDVREDKPVLVAYKFGKPEKLVAELQKQGITGQPSKTEDVASEEDKSLLKKFIKRYAIRLAAFSGLLGHASMGAISLATGDNKWFGTAWKYTAADATISLYGTDKSVTADPIMQDFKNYLWKQGVDNSFVKARTDKISFGESVHEFMKKRSFQIANAFGAMGNVNQVQIGLKDGNHGFVVAGLTSLFGAGLQIFGSEKKRNPEQVKRSGVLSRIFGFADSNPMQVAAITNFTDPFALFYGAAFSKKLDTQKKQENDVELLQNYATLKASNLRISGKFNGEDLNALDNVSKTAGDLAEQYKRRGNIFSFMPYSKSFDKDEAAKLEKQLGEQRSKLKVQDGLNADGTLDYAFLNMQDAPKKSFGETFKSHKKSVGEAFQSWDAFKDFFKKKKAEKTDYEKASESEARIKELKKHNQQLSSGTKWKKPLLFLVATFYTGATLLRLIARKTASGNENRDAFNEVYAAAAESLLNIQEPQKRQDMLMQMAHFLSNHPKMEEPAEKIVEALNQRVQAFAQHPFVQAPEHILAAQQGIAKEEAVAAPVPAKVEAHAKQAAVEAAAEPDKKPWAEKMPKAPAIEPAAQAQSAEAAVMAMA